jgi:alpha-soluble NSF attachment protein
MTDTKAQALMDEADKELNKFAPFTSKDEKRDKARDKYLQAATMYKAGNDFANVARAYLKAAEMSEKLKQDMDVADDTLNAALALQKVKDPAAESNFAKAVEIYDKNGKYSQAAKTCVSIAELGGEHSMDWFNRAVKYYKSEGSKATAQEIVLKMAVFHIKNGELNQARSIYEKAGRDALDDRLTRGGARKHFFMALLCLVGMISPTNIAEGVAMLEEKFHEFTEMDTQFDQYTREHMLITQLIAALENTDIDAYSEAMDEFDRICPLDDIKTKLLLRGKQALRQSDVR